jgi:hypothetical protein
VGREQSALAGLWRLLAANAVVLAAAYYLRLIGRRTSKLQKPSWNRNHDRPRRSPPPPCAISAPPPFAKPTAAVECRCCCCQPCHSLINLPASPLMDSLTRQIISLRGPRNLLDPGKPWHWLSEQEFSGTDDSRLFPLFS